MRRRLKVTILQASVFSRWAGATVSGQLDSIKVQSEWPGPTAAWAWDRVLFRYYSRRITQSWDGQDDYIATI